MRTSERENVYQENIQYLRSLRLIDDLPEAQELIDILVADLWQPISDENRARIDVLRSTLWEWGGRGYWRTDAPEQWLETYHSNIFSNVDIEKFAKIGLATLIIGIVLYVNTQTK